MYTINYSFLCTKKYFIITESNDNNFFKSIIQALMDFNEMNPIEPLQMVLEVSNIAIYIYIILTELPIWLI